jgi:hypothetical protein
LACTVGFVVGVTVGRGDGAGLVDLVGVGETAACGEATRDEQAALSAATTTPATTARLFISAPLDQPSCW